MINALNLRLDTIGLVLIIAMLFFEVLSSPIRYYSSFLGLSAIYYLPKVLLFLFAALKVLVAKNYYKWMFLLFLLVEIIYGVLNNGVISSLFSFYTWTPLWALFFIDHNIFSDKIFEKVIRYVFLITVIGVFLDTMIEFPWVGFELEILGTNVEGNREWWTAGVSRISGFTRMSAHTAIIIMVSSIYLLYGYRNNYIKIFLYLLTLACLILTTTKAAIGAFLILTPFLFGLRSLSISMFLLLSLLISNVVLIIGSVGFGLNFENPKSIVEIFLFRSFDIRLEDTWPEFYATLLNSSNYIVSLLGTGFGGVGSVIKSFGDVGFEALSTADNSILYIYGLFGIFGIIFHLYIYRLCGKLIFSEETSTIKLGFVLLGCLIVGTTTDIFENVIILLVIGFCFYKEASNNVYR